MSKIELYVGTISDLRKWVGRMEDDMWKLVSVQRAGLADLPPSDDRVHVYDWIVAFVDNRPKRSW